MFSGLELEFLQGNLKVYREYDIANFISTAKSVITESQNPVELNDSFKFYTDTINKSINSFNDVKIDPVEIRTFLVKFKNVSRLDGANVSMRMINRNEVGVIKPQYLQEYVKSVSNSINEIINGGGTLSDAIKLNDPNVINTIKKQIVKSNLPYNKDIKSLIKTNNDKYVTVDNLYVKSVVIPFLTNYGAIKNMTITEADAVNRAIDETANYMKGMVEVINKLKVSDDLDSETITKLSQVSYNAIRGILDIVAYVTYMEVRKLKNLNADLISCEKLQAEINNLYNEDNVIEMTQFDDSILPQDVESLSDGLIHGNSDAYSLLSKNIYNFHKNSNNGIPAEYDDDNDTMNSSIDNETSQEPFNSGIYNDVRKMYKEISDGLDIIASKSDDYLMVFDDVISKAGFSIELQNRFKDLVESIPEMPLYRSASQSMSNGVPNVGVYNSMLTEVEQYETIMGQIADSINSTYLKILGLQKRFTDNINGEFKNAQAVNELKIFMSSLLEQYRVLTNSVARGLMIRLRRLGIYLTEIEAQVDSNAKAIDFSTTPLEVGSDVDFCESLLDDDTFEEETELIFKDLQIAYYVEKAKAIRGVDVYFEADEVNTTNNTGNNGTDANNKDSTKVTVTDNSEGAVKQGSFTDIANKLSLTIRKIIEKFANLIGKDSKVNLKWLNENKQSLLTRNYTNTSVQMLPYVNHDQHKQYLSSLANNVKAITPQDLQKFNNNIPEIYNRLFTNITTVDINNDTDKKAITDKFTYFAECGSINQPQRAQVANSDLKAKVQNEWIPQIEVYYNTGSAELKNSATEVNNAFDELIKKVGGDNTTTTNNQQTQNQPQQQPQQNTQQNAQPAQNNQQQNTNANNNNPQVVNASAYTTLSLDELSKIYLEADAGDNTKASYTSTLNTMRFAITAFISAILTASRRRTNDYLTALSALTPRPDREQDKLNSGKPTGTDTANDDGVDNNQQQNNNAQPNA
jgi:hypothetical protein